MLTEGGERDGVGGDGGEAEATRGRRESGELGEEEEGIRPRGGLGENRFNSSVGGENALLLKSVVVAPFLEGRYYYT